MSPDLQSNIPDGYELVPIDRITDEYEIVPWNEVQTLLNVTVVHPDKRETILPSIPHSTYAPPVSPYKEAGYSTSTYLHLKSLSQSLTQICNSANNVVEGSIQILYRNISKFVQRFLGKNG